MIFETIIVETDARGIATVTLNRPDKHNALNAAMIAELAEAAGRLARDGSVRGVVLAAAGKTFCAGADLGWMKAQAQKDRAGKIAEAGALASMLAAWNALPKPVVARVHGNAFGGGIGLISVSDIAIMAEDVKFCLTETKLGLIPATIGPFVVHRLGEGFARQVFFTGRTFGTDFALRTGFASSVCAADELDAAVEDECVSILQCAPGAVGAAKALCLKLGGPPVADVIDDTIDALADCWETEETRLGIDAFFAKATPPWRKD
jgi:methylglutaconyl-CoA hydratase